MSSDEMDGGEVFVMTWNEKADEIAESILEGMKDTSKECIVSALREAAIKGMEFDCKNWCMKVR